MPGGDHRGNGKWLRSTSGWALANIWFDRLHGLPEEGSHQELMAILLQGHRLRGELTRTKLLMFKDSEGIEAVWDQYEQAVAPYLGNARRTRADAESLAARELSRAFVALGPMTILHNEGR